MGVKKKLGIKYHCGEEMKSLAWNCPINVEGMFVLKQRTDIFMCNKCGEIKFYKSAEVINMDELFEPMEVD